MPKLKDNNSVPSSVAIEVPLSDVPPGSWGLHINTHLTSEQSMALRRVTAALDRRLARLSNGQRVVNACGALKYILEAISVSSLGQRLSGPSQDTPS